MTSMRNLLVMLIALALVGLGSTACSSGAQQTEDDESAPGNGDPMDDDPQLEGDLGGGAASCTGDACVKACEEGNAKACTKAGTELVQAKKSGEAVSFFEKGCNGGDVSGCTWAGIQYRDGVGVSANAEKARTYFELACNEDDALGCLILGNMVQDGEGGEPNPSVAIDLFIKACDAGAGDACYNVGWHYTGVEGAMLEEDWSEAAKHFDRACELKSARGCTGRATIAAREEGDDAKARTLFAKACNLPDNTETLGCYQAGFFFAQGRGGPENQEAAAKYLQKACDAGNAKACGALGE